MSAMILIPSGVPVEKADRIISLATKTIRSHAIQVSSERTNSEQIKTGLQMNPWIIYMIWRQTAPQSTKE
jgi:hypothetical protein